MEQWQQWQPSKISIRMENALENHKADDLQKLLSSLNSYREHQLSSYIKQYFTESENELRSQIEEYTISKLQLLESTNAEMNRMRYLIHELNKYILNDVTVESTPSSLSFSPIVLDSPDIDMQPIDLNDIPATFRPRRYSQIPTSYVGRYKMETIKQGNGVDFPYPNDSVTVQYTMFAIDGILDLMHSYVHEIIDLTSSKCMMGLKNGLLSMSINQKCKLWIPQRLTAQYNGNHNVITQKCDVLIEVILLNIIRSDIFKDETYTNDIVLNASKSKRDRANTVSLPPLTPTVGDLTDLNGFGGHINHQTTDIALEEHKNDMKLLINEIRRNQNKSVTMNLQTPISPNDHGYDTNSETNMVEISGTKIMWYNTYKSLSKHDMIEECMTLCPNIESCNCTKRLLMILKIYQSIMYNRKQKLWQKQYVNDELLSMYYAVKIQLLHSNECIMNDFYHCRFYHGHFNRWYNFCRKHYEENYCVYQENRQCTIYSRYHRNKLKAKPLNKRREWFRILDEDDGLSDEEINEIVTLQICDMIHCFIFHSSREPYLMYAHQYPLNVNSLKIKERNTVHVDKFTFALDTQHSSGHIFKYDGESFGVLISYKDRRYSPLYDSMKDELMNNPCGISVYQYNDIAFRANIFKQSFIGRQMVNFFGKHISLQQIIAIMCYTNYIDLHHAFGATLHCHNLDYDGMISLRQSHCELFWHWSKMLFSVVDSFGDPIEKECEFMCRLGNYSQLSIHDLSFNTECIYSVSSDKLAFTSSDGVIAAIGAKRFGSLYFDVSLLSDYPYENEVLLGPSQHLEIRNLIMKNYDNEIYLNAMYIMDTLIGHKLGPFHYNFNESYLHQIIKVLLGYIDGHIDELKLGHKLCYEYWQNKANIRLNMNTFKDDISMKELIQYFLIEREQISFNFINTIILFPNLEQIQINNIDLNSFLCKNVLQLIETLSNKDHQIYCGQKLNKIQLFGDENNKDNTDFVQNLFDEYVTKFDNVYWRFQIESLGNWLFTKTQQSM